MCFNKHKAINNFCLHLANYAFEKAHVKLYKIHNNEDLCKHGFRLIICLVDLYLPLG